MMERVWAFLRERLAERAVTLEEVQKFGVTAAAIIAALGPLIGFLLPDPAKPEDAKQAAKAAVSATKAVATKAAALVAGPAVAAKVEARVSQVEEEVAHLAGQLKLPQERK
jgi:uncharacterized protein YceH (UPF0502 family)